MNVADTVAFTISFEFEDISNKFPKKSEQFRKKEIKKKNEDLQRELHISSNLENPVEKNQNRIIGRT
jgi:hypothetical protein